MRKVVLRAAVAGIAVAALAASLTGPATAANNPTPAQIAAGYMKLPTKITQKVPLKAKPPKGVKVAYMLQGIPTQIAVAKYVKEAAEAVGWNYLEVPWVTTDPARVNSSLQTAMQQGAQIIIAPGVSTSLVSETVRNQLAEARIPVILGQACETSALKAPFVAGFAWCANEAPLAKSLAAWVTTDSKGSGKVLLESIPSLSLLDMFQKLFRAELAKQCPGCSVTVQQITFPQFIGGQVPGIMVSALRRDPSLEYLFFDSGQLSTGILPALDAAGLLSKVKVGGRSADAPSQQALRDKQEVVWTIQSFATTGYAAMDAALRIITKSSGINGNHALPVQLLTTVNINSVPNPYEPVPVAAFAQYKKLWRVG